MERHLDIIYLYNNLFLFFYLQLYKIFFYSVLSAQNSNQNRMQTGCEQEHRDSLGLLHLLLLNPFASSSLQTHIISNEKWKWTLSLNIILNNALFTVKFALKVLNQHYL